MKALRNKKTGRLLKLDQEAHEGYEYGIIEEVRVIRKYLELKDNEYKGIIFVTTDDDMIQDLLRDGHSSYPDVRIDFGWNKTLFSTKDLEIVEL